ncbi:MAG TPA: DUF72 domain-containing protein [Polyangiales bacterium]
MFYPRGLKQARELEFASRAFDTIEINGSFYSLQTPQTYQTWYEQTPLGFVFAVKGGRYITHMKRLNAVETALANFFASGLLRLREKLGPILWQLPPTLSFDRARMQSFLEHLPKTTDEAAELAARHDARLNGRAETRPLIHAPLRHAIEVRHPSFSDPRYIELLRKFQVACCVADTAGEFPWLEDVTASFVYVRLHGAEQLYTSGYDTAALKRWARRVRAWSSGKEPPNPRHAAPESRASSEPREAFVYFDNDVKARAPFDAANLRRLLDGQTSLRSPAELASVTEEPRTEWPAWTSIDPRLSKG